MTEITSKLTNALADRYRIEKHIGQGGMATVYLAHDIKHDRKVALKVLRSELAAVLGAERFLAEIKTTANLQHPHILPLHDSGEVNGTVFYVMPFVEGETLRDRLDKEKQLPVNEAVRITTEIAAALDYAHRHDIIHRDIKPENILLHDGSALVADFGIALAAVRSEGDTRLTETGMSLGTPHYMSPEQAMGERDIDARADIYALGSVLYEMLSGEPPFTGPTVQSIVAKVMTASPEPVTTYRKTAPPNVAAAVHTALEKLPADRFATAAKFAEALTDSQFTTHTQPIGPAPSVARRARLVMPLAGVAVLAAAIATWALLRPPPAPQVIRYALALPPSQAPDPSNLAIPTADGSRIVYVGLVEGTANRQLWVKDRDKQTARPLAGTTGVVNFTLSPDGAWVAFTGANEIRKVPLDGGAGLTVVDDGVGPRLGGIAWLDDGTIVYTMVGGARRLARVSDQGGESMVIWESDSMTAIAVQPLPGGRGLLFQSCVAPCADPGIWALDLESGEAHLVLDGATYAHYLPTGHLGFVRPDAAMLAVSFDLTSLQTRGPPVPLLDSVAAAGSVPLIAISASGTLVMRSGTAVNLQEFELVWVDQTGQVTVIDSSETFRHVAVAGNLGWALSPDETQLAIGLATGSGDDIWVKSLPQGPLSKVSFDEGAEYRPRWMPDGESVMFNSTRMVNGLYRRRADGTGEDSLMVQGAFDEGAISPDGRWILLRSGATSAAAGGRDIFAVEIGVDSVPRPFLASPYDEEAIAISPDGRAVAYQSDETGRNEVFVRRFPDVEAGKLQISEAGGTGALWSRDGRELYYRNSNAEMIAVRVTVGLKLQAGEPRVLFRIPADVAVVDAAYYTPWDVASDGRFIMARSVAGPSQLEAPLIVVENWFEELKAKVGRE